MAFEFYLFDVDLGQAAGIARTERTLVYDGRGQVGYLLAHRMDREQEPHAFMGLRRASPQISN